MTLECAPGGGLKDCCEGKADGEEMPMRIHHVVNNPGGKRQICIKLFEESFGFVTEKHYKPTEETYCGTENIMYIFSFANW